jgi:phosphoglycerate dehydrogenase-like enzyme
MKSTALLVNVARGPVVDESALYAALAERRIAGAALDVWWHEPDWSGRGAPASLPFRDLDNVLMTPHLAAVTGELLRRRLADIAANVNRLAAGEELLNVVHPG